MYCTSCGKQIDDNAMFCPYCGVKVLASKSDFETGLSNSSDHNPGSKGYDGGSWDESLSYGGAGSKGGSGYSDGGYSGGSGSGYSSSGYSSGSGGNGYSSSGYSSGSGGNGYSSSGYSSGSGGNGYSSSGYSSGSGGNGYSSSGYGSGSGGNGYSSSGYGSGSGGSVQVTVQALAGPVAPALEADRMDRTGAVTGHLKKERIPRSFGDRERQRG